MRAALNLLWLEARLLSVMEAPPRSRFIKSQRERLLIALVAYRSQGTGLN